MAAIDPNALYANLMQQVSQSRLNGWVPKDGERFGIKTGSPQEWARLFTMLARQESGLRQAPVNPDGSLARFASTPAGERSFGPYQFNVGEYGLSNWSDVNDPEKAGAAVIRVAEKFAQPSGYLSGPNNTGMSAYFGSFRRPNEVLQHGQWADQTLQANRGGSMNGGYGMSPTGAGGISGPVQTSTPKDDISALFNDFQFGLRPNTPADATPQGNGGGISLPFGFKLAGASGGDLPSIPQTQAPQSDPLDGIDWGGVDFSNLFALAQGKRKVGV